MNNNQASRSIPSSNVVDRVSNSSSEDLTPVSAFVLDEGSRDARFAELFIRESHAPVCLSRIYRENFFAHVSAFFQRKLSLILELSV